MHRVDDTKMSHMNPLVVDKVLEMLESNVGKLKIARGKHDEFLGMKITCQDDGCFLTNMRPYLQKTVG